jgi:hypothetical protein
MVSCSMDLTRTLQYSVTLHYADMTYRPIDVFVTYDGKRASDIPVSRYAVRHLVAAEVGLFSDFYVRKADHSFFQVDALILSRHAETKELSSSRKRPRTLVTTIAQISCDLD